MKQIVVSSQAIEACMVQLYTKEPRPTSSHCQRATYRCPQESVSVCDLSAFLDHPVPSKERSALLR